MAANWQTRRKQIDQALPSLREALKHDLRGSGAVHTKLTAAAPDDTGTLLDLVQLLPESCKNNST